MRSNRSKQASTRRWRRRITASAMIWAISAIETPTWAEDAGALVLPKVAEGVAGQRIGWHFDEIAPALEQASSDGKPLVVVVVTEPCGWCRIVLTHVLRCNGLNSLAGRAHFILLTHERRTSADFRPQHPEAAHFIDLLKIEGFPTVEIVSVKNKEITPVARVAGAATEARLLQFLADNAALKTATGAAAADAAVGLPKPAACGATPVDAALADSAPLHLQKGIAR
ncbi:hypothetical protein IY145_00715 [Methylosinus sp. H3A]|uniref:hypothetical protein n=1 Tax=Methylosinus sp. H3A TaxID=2785786 RepID=UPI0018C22D2B|nr:hypothetical protein [Methylosinus sp. H3A]MBG0807953.1 hypothetical protein [Methylosinus sp. H3A]